MDAIEFLQEYRKMCEKYAYMEACGEDCSSECPLKNCYCDLRDKHIDIENAISKVEQWSKEHPQKTMMRDFFEKFPNAPKSNTGTPRDICPNNCGYTNEPDNYSTCDQFNNDCLKCWSRPMEEKT